eukprot:scaffold31607_cov117-Skeletonema_marinoi.AAC.1
MSSVCLSAERTAKLKVTMLDCPMVMSLVCPLAHSMAMQKDLQMAHMRPLPKDLMKHSEMISPHDAP